MSKYYIRMDKNTEDSIYEPDATEEARASMKLSKQELKEMKRIAEIKGDATPQQVLRAFLTKALRYDF